MPAIFGSAFIACMLVFTFDVGLIDDFKINWLIIMGVILTIRVADTVWWKTKCQNTNYSGSRLIYHFATGLYATAIMWCIYALVVFQHADNIEFATVLISLAAMASGGATLVAADKKTAIIYILILLCPTSTALSFSGDSYQQPLGIMSFVFCALMILITRKVSNFIATAITLKNENAVLIHNMEGIVEERTQQIYELSNLDPLTHLFNRTAFLKRFKKQLQNCMQNERPIALLFIDLDGFKNINDTLGHEIGDQLLTQTAERLKQHCDEDRLLCRWGGDEFLIVIENEQESEVVEDAVQIIEHISRRYMLEKHQLSITATIGIALYPQHADTEDMLIQLADTAMYYQKKRASSKVSVFSEYLGQKLAREQKLRDGIAEAISEQQLRLVFQPIVSSSDGEVNAFEALLRWRLDEEEVYPNEFIRIAEQYGYICKIGEWVLEHACMAASQWQADKPVAVCVNVSVIQLHDKNFLAAVDAALAKSLLPAEKLHIEITESVFANDKDIVLSQIKALQNKGINVSIDDFGTGYSSLSVMQDLSVNVVKIDRSFIANIDTSGFAIINAVMHIAHTLDYHVTAEGVETIHQARMLANMGVHFQQGFYYAKPIEQDKIKPYLAEIKVPLLFGKAHTS